MTVIKREESVLVALALFLFAGVILYNVFTSPTEIVSDVSSVIETTSLIFEEKLQNTTTTISQVVTTTSTSEVSLKININTATKDELMTLNGIGEVKALAIIEYRETYGMFPSIDSLVNVSGIGEKTLAKISDKITV